MKIRCDYVTNSSSSSFIISRKYVTRDRLLEILLEIANTEGEYRGWDGKYTRDEDIVDNTVAYRYRVTEATPESPHTVDDYCWLGSQAETFDNHFIIDNDDCGRYNWDAVEEILAKYNIPWAYGYCD